MACRCHKPQPGNPIPPPSTPPSTGEIVDRLSYLPEDVLLHILSFISTKFSARTSLICRRFHRLWESSPVLNLATYDYNPEGVTPAHLIRLANRIVLYRNPPSPILRLHLCLPHIGTSYIAALLNKAGALGLKHLTIHLVTVDNLQRILLSILSLRYLQSLSFECTFFHKITPYTAINLKHLKNISIDVHVGCHVGANSINQLVSRLDALEDLYIRSSSSELDLKSETLRKLKLKLNRPNFRISAPSLEHFELKSGLYECLIIQWEWEMPMLKKAAIEFYGIYENSVGSISNMLNTISHAQELHLSFVEWYGKDTFHALLLPSLDPPTFIKLKHLHLEICFHEFNIEDLVTIIQHSPALETLKLVHQPSARLWGVEKNKLWRSMLPQNAEGNNIHAYYKNLHITEKKDDLLRKLIKKKSSEGLKT